MENIKKINNKKELNKKKAEIKGIEINEDSKTKKWKWKIENRKWT